MHELFKVTAIDPMNNVSSARTYVTEHGEAASSLRLLQLAACTGVPNFRTRSRARVWMGLTGRSYLAQKPLIFSDAWATP